MMIACGGEDDGQSGQIEAPELSEREQALQDIQAVLDETIERFKYFDKSALYEMELEYYKDQTTYGEYLEEDGIRHFNPDSVARIVAQDLEFRGPDTAAVDVQVVFVGPTGDSSFAQDTYTFLKRDGQWIKPTITSNYAAIREQQRYEELIRQADSAAKAEAEEGNW